MVDYKSVILHDFEIIGFLSPITIRAKILRNIFHMKLEFLSILLVACLIKQGRYVAEYMGDKLDFYRVH